MAEKRERQGGGSSNAPEAGADRSLYLTEVRSEEHTSELQSQSNLVCRLLLEKKKKKKRQHIHITPRQLTTHFTSNHSNYFIQPLTRSIYIFISLQITSLIITLKTRTK